MSSEIILETIESDLMPGQVDYAILLPPGYEESAEPLPLLVNMHGGGLDRNYLASQEVKALYEKLWEEGRSLLW